MTHKFKQGYWANAFYQIKLIFFRPGEFKQTLPSDYTRLDFITHLLYLQPATILILSSILASFYGLFRFLGYYGIMSRLLESPFPWFDIVFGIAVTVIWGIILGIFFGTILGRAYKIVFGSILGIVFEITLGSAYVIALGVTEGLAEGIAYGIAVGIAVGVVSGVVGKVSVGVIEGIAVGIVFGFAYGATGGIAYGSSVGIVGGLAYVVSVYRIWYLPYHLLQYLFSILMPGRAIAIYQRSPLLFDELVGFVFPFLSSMLIRMLNQDREAGLDRIEFILAKRPIQKKAGEKALNYANSQ